MQGEFRLSLLYITPLKSYFKKMNDIEYLNEFYKFVSTDSILVVTKTGELIRLYCPFEVTAKVNFEEIAAGEIVRVEKVQVTPENRDIFIIKSKAYFVNNFKIIPDGLSIPFSFHSEHRAN
jgi:hypothetical protein